MGSHRDTWPELLRLGWPVTATGIVRVTMRSVDLLVIGLVLGAAGVAALGIGDAFAQLVMRVSFGLGAGTIATVSQHLGAGRRDDADRAATQSALLALALGLPLAVTGWWAAPVLFPLLGAADDVVELGVPYLQLVLAGSPALTFSILATRALQGAGDTRTPMLARTSGTVLNIALTIVLVTGPFGLPQFGVAGAAWGTLTGELVSATWLLVHLRGARSAVNLRREHLWAPATARRIVAIGAPQVLERSLYATAEIPLNAILLSFGTAANAGYQVGRRIHLYALLPCRGVATAASTFMGNHVGALDPDGGDRYGRGAVLLSALMTATMALPLAVFAEPIATLFVRDGDALAQATTWIRVFLVVTLVRGIYLTLRGAMQGAGETRSALLVSALGVGIFTVGFSWFVGIQLEVGIVAVHLAVVLDFVLRASVLARWYHHGRWRRVLAAPAASGGASAG